MTEEQFLSNFKTSRDFIHDFNNFLECNKKLQNYNRSAALGFLNNITNEYQNEINIFGQFFDGDQTISFAYFSDYEIQAQLKYLCIHIPVYSLIKKGEADLAKKVFNWIMEMWNPLKFEYPVT